jgi:stage II sporulation protein E
MGGHKSNSEVEVMHVRTHLKNLFIRPVEWFGVERSRQKRAIHRLTGMWNIPVIVMGVLLGRATILDFVSPFAIAYVAVILYLARKQWPVVMASLIAGAATLGGLEAAKTTGTLIILLFLQRVWEWVGKGQINYAPFVVGLGSIAAHLLELWWTGFRSYQVMLSAVDVTLSFILTFIFVQSLPIFTVKKKRVTLRHEEIVCLVILLGSVMTGTIGLKVGDLSLVHIVSRYAILMFALVGGGMLGSSMGVVTGLILSLSDTRALSEISLLAFSGLLAGLFKEGKRIGVAIGFMLGSAILTLYGGGTSAMWLSLKETAVAIIFLLLTPERVVRTLSRYVPGTSENQIAHQEYIKRLRDVTAKKVSNLRNYSKNWPSVSARMRPNTAKRMKTKSRSSSRKL